MAVDDIQLLSKKTSISEYVNPMKFCGQSETAKEYCVYDVYFRSFSQIRLKVSVTIQCVCVCVITK